MIVITDHDFTHNYKIIIDYVSDNYNNIKIIDINFIIIPNICDRSYVGN